LILDQKRCRKESGKVTSSDELGERWLCREETSFSATIKGGRNLVGENLNREEEPRMKGDFKKRDHLIRYWGKAVHSRSKGGRMKNKEEGARGVGKEGRNPGNGARDSLLGKHLSQKGGNRGGVLS